MANKATQEAGLTFNVNTIRGALKEYYDSQGLSSFQMSGGQTALTAALEKLWEFTLRECMKRVGKNKAGMREVTVNELSRAVLEHVGLEHYFLICIKNFDSTRPCLNPPVSAADMNTVMERVSTELTLTPKARNLACCLLLDAFADLARTSHLFVECSKKSSLTARNVLYSISSKFHESVAHELRSEVIRAMKASGEELEDTEVADGSEHVVPQASQPAGDADDGTDPTKDAKAADKKVPAKTDAKKPTGKAASKAEEKKIDVSDDQIDVAPADDTAADETAAADEASAPAKPAVANKAPSKQAAAAPAAKKDVKKPVAAKK